MEYPSQSNNTKTITLNVQSGTESASDTIVFRFGNNFFVGASTFGVTNSAGAQDFLDALSTDQQNAFGEYYNETSSAGTRGYQDVIITSDLSSTITFQTGVPTSNDPMNVYMIYPQHYGSLNLTNCFLKQQNETAQITATEFDGDYTNENGKTETYYIYRFNEDVITATADWTITTT